MEVCTNNFIKGEMSNICQCEMSNINLNMLIFDISQNLNVYQMTTKSFTEVQNYDFFKFNV